MANRKDDLKARLLADGVARLLAGTGEAPGLSKPFALDEVRRVLQQVLRRT